MPRPPKKSTPTTALASYQAALDVAQADAAPSLGALAAELLVEAAPYFLAVPAKS